MGVYGFEFVRMNDIFGVVNDDGFEPGAARLFFVKEHALIDPVQAIRLGGWTVVRAGCNPNIGPAALCFGQCVSGPGIVRIDAGENLVVRVAQARDVVGQHVKDYVVFSPERDEDRDAAFCLAG